METTKTTKKQALETAMEHLHKAMWAVVDSKDMVALSIINEAQAKLAALLGVQESLAK